jgi:hypothetical protein
MAKIWLLAVIACHPQGVLTDECGDFCDSKGCDWTSDWSCPWADKGKKGKAADDGSTGFKCCCTKRKSDEQPCGGEASTPSPSPPPEAKEDEALSPPPSPPPAEQDKDSKEEDKDSTEGDNGGDEEADQKDDGNDKEDDDEDEGDIKVLTGTKCNGTAYTDVDQGMKNGCNGFPGKTAQQCRDFCVDNAKAPNCPKKTCYAAVHYPVGDSKKGFCHLFTKDQCSAPLQWWGHPTTYIKKSMMSKKEADGHDDGYDDSSDDGSAKEDTARRLHDGHSAVII